MPYIYMLFVPGQAPLSQPPQTLHDQAIPKGGGNTMHNRLKEGLNHPNIPHPNS